MASQEIDLEAINAERERIRAQYLKPEGERPQSAAACEQLKALGYVQSCP